MTFATDLCIQISEVYIKGGETERFREKARRFLLGFFELGPVLPPHTGLGVEWRNRAARVSARGV